MNNPDDMPIDVEEMVKWLKSHKEMTGISWAALSKASLIGESTLSALYGGSYKGDWAAQARKIFRYRQKVESQRERSRTALSPVSFIPTPTARRVQFLLEVAHMGRITVGAMGPGTGKTRTAAHYVASMQPTWMCTMLPSGGQVSSMVGRVMQSMGLIAKHSWTSVRSAQVIEFLMNRRGLLIIDEAGNLTRDALEELRSWHDVTGVGICLLGNEELMMRIRGGENRHAFARLSSRIANYVVQDMPLVADVEAYLDAMDIIEPDMRRPLVEIGTSPGHGGLREVQQILESANMLAIGSDETLGWDHVRSARDNRATTIVRRAA